MWTYAICGSIKKCSFFLARHGNQIIPLLLEETEAGEITTFNISQLLNVVISAYELSQLAKNRSLNFATTSDGAEFTKNMHQVVVGFKVVDVSAIDPLTGESVKLQSRKMCWPSQIVMGREAEKMHTYHSNIVHQWWDACKIVDDNGNVLNQKFPSMKLLDSCCLYDMSAL